MSRKKNIFIFVKFLPYFGASYPKAHTHLGNTPQLFIEIPGELRWHLFPYDIFYVWIVSKELGELPNGKSEWGPMCLESSVVRVAWCNIDKGVRNHAHTPKLRFHRALSLFAKTDMLLFLTLKSDYTKRVLRLHLCDCDQSYSNHLFRRATWMSIVLHHNQRHLGRHTCDYY